MAGSVNKVILVGNLGKDPEIRRTQDGRPIANLRIATTETWRDKSSGERREKTEWHSRRHLQREPVQGRRAVPEEGRQGLHRGRSCRRANGRTSTARSATRPRSCCRASTASSPCSTGAAPAPACRRAARPTTAMVVAASAVRLPGRAAARQEWRQGRLRQAARRRDSVLKPGLLLDATIEDGHQRTGHGRDQLFCAW